MTGGEIGYLRGLSDSWLSRLRKANDARRAWRAIADQCAQFFFADSGFMWRQEYLDKYVGSGITPPKFQMTPNEAFKLVSVMGPALFWQYPNRKVISHEREILSPEVFGGDPDLLAEYELLAERDAVEFAQQQARNALMQKYLNYSQREQPGGLALHARSMVTEMMVRGRSLLLPQTYRHPGSSRLLTGLFFKSSLDLFVDPDCRSADLSDASWVCLRWRMKRWEVEDRFGLPRGKLKSNGDRQPFFNEDADLAPESRGNDVVTWFEVFSKCGVGARFEEFGPRNVDRSYVAAIEEIVGDYAYLCIAPDCDYLLNAPDEVLSEADEEQVRLMFRWPLESWRDNRWPFAVCDAHALSGTPLGCWPMPPLGPAIGYLTAYNILLSSFVEQSYMNRKVLIGVLQEESEKVRRALNSLDNPAVVELANSSVQDIQKVVQYLTHPPGNHDNLRAMEFLKQQIEEATGLTPHTYAQTTTQSRSAEDVRVKEERATIRQEQMSRDVATAITEASNMEMFLAAQYVDGDDLRPLLGRVGAMAWRRLITSAEPIEELMLEMRASVEASDMRRPSKARDAANMQALMDRALPVLQSYAAITGDWNPVNVVLQRYGEATEQPMGDLALQNVAQREPEGGAEPTEEQMAIESQMAAEQAAKDAEQEAKLANQIAQLDLKRQAKELDLAFSLAKHEQELEMANEKAEQELLLAAARDLGGV